MPLKLTWGIAKRSFFSNPFRFFLVLAIFPFCAFKTDLGNCQKELFLEPFSFFFRFGNFFLSLPLKLTWGIAKEAFSRTLFIFFHCFLFFLRFGIFFLPLPLELTSGIAKRSFFSNPFHFFHFFHVFSFFLRFGIFSFLLPLKLT